MKHFSVFRHGGQHPEASVPVKAMNTTHSLCSELCCANRQDSEEVSVSLCHDPFCIISTLRNGGDNGLSPYMELHVTHAHIIHVQSHAHFRYAESVRSQCAQLLVS